MSCATTKKTLLVSDLDNTLFNGNSNMAVKDLAPNSILPEDIDDFSKYKDGWTDFMRRIFGFFYSEGIVKEDYFERLSNLPLIEGMGELLVAANGLGNYEIVILSDANTVFIDFLLKINGLRDIVSKIITNSAFFDEDGCLVIYEYQIQDDCDRCFKNMCKGSILLEHIQMAKTPYEKVIYMGDGMNDICPALKLGPNDLVFARKGFAMAEGLTKLKEKNVIPAATLYEWETGKDIKAILFPENKP